MIGTLLAALAIAAAPESLLVRRGDRTVTVPVVETGDARALRADLLATALAGSVRRGAGAQFVVSLPGVDFTVEPAVPFVRVNGDVVPVVLAPFTRAGQLYLPLQLAADLLPRLGSGVLYDATRGELRVFSTTARSQPAGTPAAASAGAMSPGAPAGDTAARTTATPGGASPAESRPRRPARRLVVVDAGHGGPDRGMAGPLGAPPRLTEKDVTLSVAFKVAAALRDRGVDVVMTRTRDTLIALSDRGRIANAKRGDLFLSIHVNASGAGARDAARERGFETYFLAEAKTEDESRVERMENEAVRFETGANARKGDPLSFIINDMAQNEHLRESNELAGTVQRALAQVHPGPNRGVKQANFAVLRTSFMPAVLIEIGFGTNAAEADYLNGATSQRRIAESIAAATVDYLSRYDRRVGVSAR